MMTLPSFYGKPDTAYCITLSKSFLFLHSNSSLLVYGLMLLNPPLSKYMCSLITTGDWLQDASKQICGCSCPLYKVLWCSHTIYAHPPTESNISGLCPTSNAMEMLYELLFCLRVVTENKKKNHLYV